jgi:hypothetical protein
MATGAICVAQVLHHSALKGSMQVFHCAFKIHLLLSVDA